MTEDERLALRTARAAVAALVDIRGSGATGTAGDTRGQAVVVEALGAARPADAILSEEAVDDLARLDADRVWIVDPLDGTREFAEGRDDWAVHIALWERGGGLTAAAVASPGIARSTADPSVQRVPHDGLRIAVSRSRPPRFAAVLADGLGATLVPMGSAGVKSMAVVDGTVDAYVHDGGQFEWDSAAPVAVARAAGLHTSRLDGSSLVYNRADPWLPDLLVCRPELTDRLLAAVAEGRGGMNPYALSTLRALEAESIGIIREVAAEMQRPCLLFSGGKDSIVLSHLARKAFAPARVPFPVLHVDTGLNFPEVLAFRDEWVARNDLRLLVASVPDAIARGVVREEPNGSRNRIQTPVLLEAAEEHGFDALFGGARRDEEKARAKERVFSFRDDFGQWDPKDQRPELWALYNGRVHQGESIRVFPLSNWTELDIWTYIDEEGIPVPPLYFAAEREVVQRKGMLYAVNAFVPLHEGETAAVRSVRYRTMGDANLTAAVPSTASTVPAIVAEIAAARLTERGATRGDDRVSEAAMEDRKREGYF